MRRQALMISVIPALLAGCQRASTESSSDHHGGRYEGVGIATPGDQWSKLADAPKPISDKAATLSDDDYVVFVTDTKTGEVRECGDRSGFCIQLRPWDKQAPLAPLPVTEHTQHKSDSGADATTSNESMPTE